MKNYMKNPLLITFLFAALLIGCNEGPDDSKERAEEVNKERFDDSDIKDDAEFAVQAADRGLFEVRASELAQSKATDPNIRDMAEMMIEDHRQANNELQEIASRKNIQLPTAISDDQKDKYEDLAEKDGSDFDEEYLDKMIDSHEEMIDNFRSHVDDTNDPDIQNWVSQQIPTLEQHLDNLKRYKDNYDGSNMGMDGDDRSAMDDQNVDSRDQQKTGPDRNSPEMQDRGTTEQQQGDQNQQDANQRDLADDEDRTND